ncbi:MAG TPA: hypothetical protein VNR37_03315 [Microbacteriaceae bacterium]|nr:hypothetical protein [Microbacteriaceae bacterium]
MQDVPLFESIEAAWPTITGLSPAEHEYDRLVSGVPDLARPTDPAESHAAALAILPKRKRSQIAVLRLIAELGWIDGQELNREYRERYANTDMHLSYDSPRKRAGELIEPGLVQVRSGHIAANGNPAREFKITDLGWARLREVTA